MTQFEIIILSIIYIFCYGFVLAMFIKEDNVWFRLLWVILSLVLAIYYAPFIIGRMLYDKLEGK